ncbi:MAG: hypothetical protein ACOCV4_08810 [Myxococcota bacterium]
MAGALLLVRLAMGCDDGPPAQAMDAGSQDAGHPSLRVGHGETGYEPLADGDEVLLHMGMQGGWHVFAGARAGDVSPEGAELDYALVDPATGSAVTQRRTVLLGDEQVLWDGASWERFGDAVVIDGTDSDVLGRTLDLTATLRPETGPSLTDIRSVVVAEAP